MKTQTPTNDFYSQWMEGQTALLKTWTETATKAAGSLSDGNIAGAVKSSTELYATMLEQQQEITKNMMLQAESLTKNMATAAPFGGLWNTPNASNQANPASGQFPFGDPAAMMNYWSQMPNAMIKPWTAMMPSNDMMKQWSQFAEAGSSSFALFGQVAKMYEHWQHFSQSWSGSAQKMYSALGDNLPAGVAQDTFRNMLSGATAYMKLFEFWMPALEMMKSEKPLSAEDLQKLMNPAKYKEVIDAVFEFMMPEAMQSLFGQMYTFAQSLQSSTQQASQTMMTMMEQNAKTIFGLMAHNPEAAMGVYNTLLSGYQQALASSNALPMTQRGREMAEISQHILERFGEYYSTITNFQYLLYTNGEKALEKVSETFFTSTRKAQTPTNFDELFATWVNTNEEVFRELFETKEYTAVQSTLAQTSSLLHKDFERLFEVMLKDFPVVTRSHVDELAKTVFELKRKVRDLEKHGAEDSKGEETKASAKSAPKKATVSK